MSKKFKVDKNNLKRGTKKKKSSSMPGIILVLGIGAGIFLSCKNYIPSSTKENSQHTAQKATPAAAQDSPEKSAKTEIAKPKVEKVESVKVDLKFINLSKLTAYVVMVKINRKAIAALIN